MTKPVRLTTVLPLLVALLVAGLFPAAGSWSCPDGTTCVYTAGRGFHCLGDQCRMPCCVGSRRRYRCPRCNQGTLAQMDAATGLQGRSVRVPGGCRYHEGQQIGPVMAPQRAVLVLERHARAVLPAPVEMPAPMGLFAAFLPASGSRLSSSCNPPSSPRAPPGQRCA